MTHRTLRLSDGATVTAMDLGQGEPLVLIHGVGMNARAWAPQIADLSREWRVIAIDMPGHGGSSLLPAGAGLKDYVAWAARVIEALALGCVNVAGHSMGALIATGLAVDCPELIRRVAVLNGVHRRTPEARAAVEARAEDIARGAYDADAPLSRWFGPADAAIRAQVAGWLHAVDPHGYAAAYGAFARGDDVYADDWHRITCPALVLTGDNDANSTADMTCTMAASAPRGRAVVIRGHRHMVNLTAADQVTAALQTWLKTPLMIERDGVRA